MFDANPQNLFSTNIASIFRNSLVESQAKLAAIPPFLVLAAPHHMQSSYRYVIPDREIVLDYRVLQFVCLKCGTTNPESDVTRDFYSCSECLASEPSLLQSPSTDAFVKCYCTVCFKEIHQRLTQKQIPEHKFEKLNNMQVKLKLFAVLCIELAHYVAFVKCQSQRQQPQWLFFDSMSDRLYNEKNVPLVAPVPKFDEWIATAEREEQFFLKLDERLQQGKPLSRVFDDDGMRQLRLFRDGAFFFYENPTITYH